MVGRWILIQKSIWNFLISGPSFSWKVASLSQPDTNVAIQNVCPCLGLFRGDAPLWKCKAGLKLGGCSPVTARSLDTGAFPLLSENKYDNSSLPLAVHWMTYCLHSSWSRLIGRQSCGCFWVPEGWLPASAWKPSWPGHSCCDSGKILSLSASKIRWDNLMFNSLLSSVLISTFYKFIFPSKLCDSMCTFIFNFFFYSFLSIYVFVFRLATKRIKPRSKYM